jgi:hypothetical protein
MRKISPQKRSLALWALPTAYFIDCCVVLCIVQFVLPMNTCLRTLYPYQVKCWLWREVWHTSWFGLIWTQRMMTTPGSQVLHLSRFAQWAYGFWTMVSSGSPKKTWPLCLAIRLKRGQQLCVGKIEAQGHSLNVRPRTARRRVYDPWTSWVK